VEGRKRKRGKGSGFLPRESGRRAAFFSFLKKKM